MVEGGGWKGNYSELEEVVCRLEEEGEKEWKERKGKRRGRGGGMEWREMGRLAHEVGWEIEKRKGMTEEGRGGDGEMITLRGMKKNLEEEKNRAVEEKLEAEKRVMEEKRKREEAEHAKREAEERVERMKMELEQMKQSEEEERRRKEEEERRYIPITSLDGTSVIFPYVDGIKREGNRIINISNSYQNCFIGGVITTV